MIGLKGVCCSSLSWRMATRPSSDDAMRESAKYHSLSRSSTRFVVLTSFTNSPHITKSYMGGYVDHHTFFIRLFAQKYGQCIRIGEASLVEETNP